METTTFDAITRSLAKPSSRRVAIIALAGGLGPIRSSRGSYLPGPAPTVPAQPGVLLRPLRQATRPVRTLPCPPAFLSRLLKTEPLGCVCRWTSAVLGKKSATAGASRSRTSAVLRTLRAGSSCATMAAAASMPPPTRNTAAPATSHALLASAALPGIPPADDPAERGRFRLARLPATHRAERASGPAVRPPSLECRQPCRKSNDARQPWTVVRASLDQSRLGTTSAGGRIGLATAAAGDRVGSIVS